MGPQPRALAGDGNQESLGRRRHWFTPRGRLGPVLPHLEVDDPPFGPDYVMEGADETRAGSQRATPASRASCVQWGGHAAYLGP